MRKLIAIILLIQVLINCSLVESQEEEKDSESVGQNLQSGAQDIANNNPNAKSGNYFGYGGYGGYGFPGYGWRRWGWGRRWGYPYGGWYGNGFGGGFGLYGRLTNANNETQPKQHSRNS